MRVRGQANSCESSCARRVKLRREGHESCTSTGMTAAGAGGAGEEGGLKLWGGEEGVADVRGAFDDVNAAVVLAMGAVGGCCGGWEMSV